ncbi:hypothetical protein F4815DRAFT_472792 [Daldinia loculata]|uniref:uncharacterized protein n=1 Tax=Daldinia loculata TaxID=103429 RepID=UPI0020C22AC9|nr:uncharacterized protein F4817DRAFT_150779 [Daldinia loculata]KAI1646304.1 hypothetical protein F4817DRAFT_150779 [Daldinia loculata]KAI2779641.1 hypothetical protein F4815DRAFT_472792 [Daldinia loculata]
MSENQEKSKCGVCGKAEGGDIAIKRCGRCKASFYCSTSCQQKDWPLHKDECRARADMAAGKQWYDRYRKCEDGGSHFGELELITWGGVCSVTGDELGWGNCVVSESAELKRKYEEDFKSDDIRMHQYWPQGFRWTCCGMLSDMNFGCDHHGTGPQPCSCDFCHSGKSLPDDAYKDTVPRHGLQLSRGPDPRSYDETKAATAASMRPLFGLPS